MSPAANRDERWTVQANWQVGGEARSYSPVVADTIEEAQRIAADMRETLSHFAELTITITQAEITSGGTIEEAPAPLPPLLHVLDPAGTSTLCGATLNASNAGIAPDLLDHSAGARCERCMAVLPKG